MGGDLLSLYQKVVLEHNRNPRHFHELEGATHQAEGDNPLCGDHVDVFLVIEDGVIEKASFTGAGCAILTASASLLLDFIQGKTCEEVEGLFGPFEQLVRGDTAPSEEDKWRLGDLAVFEGVRSYPARIKCATLSWQALKAAMEQADAPVTTE